MKHFINRIAFKDAIRILLTEESNLGTHTDIFVYHARTSDTMWSLVRYTWAHSFSRPFTTNKPLQCPGCGRMPGSIIYEAVRSSDDKFIIVHFRCSVKSCSWKTDVSISHRIMDVKDHLSLITRVGKQWAADNGQWCFEDMKPVLSF